MHARRPCTGRHMPPPSRSARINWHMPLMHVCTHLNPCAASRFAEAIPGTAANRANRTQRSQLQMARFAEAFFGWQVREIALLVSPEVCTSLNLCWPLDAQLEWASDALFQVNLEEFHGHLSSPNKENLACGYYGVLDGHAKCRRRHCSQVLQPGTVLRSPVYCPETPERKGTTLCKVGARFSCLL